MILEGYDPVPVEWKPDDAREISSDRPGPVVDSAGQWRLEAEGFRAVTAFVMAEMSSVMAAGRRAADCSDRVAAAAAQILQRTAQAVRWW